MKSNKQITRGSIWLVDLDPTVGHEQAKKRPCLVLSSTIFNQGPAEIIAVLPITSKDRNLWWNVRVSPEESGLPKTSFIICTQIRTISIQRLISSRIGSINTATLKQVEERIKTLLALGLED